MFIRIHILCNDINDYLFISVLNLQSNYKTTLPLSTYLKL